MTEWTPASAEVSALAQEFGIELTPEQVDGYVDIMAQFASAYEYVEQAPNYPAPVRRELAFYRPDASENPHNAWAHRFELNETASGLLAGKRVVLKDNIMLAGAPLENGSNLLEGYVADEDATVVQRVLAEGATIVGKATCEYYCIAAGSHTSHTGPVRNPHDPSRTSGGSSSGCGVLVATGDADMAIGADQGGSIRIPSSWCGIFGMKPTWGLVPYTGIMSSELYIDHAGPMTRSTYDNALLLKVIAGDDGIDQRIHGVQSRDYTSRLDGNIKGMRIGLLTEAFDHPNSEQCVNDAVRNAAEALRSLGAIVSEVSVPAHRVGSKIWTPVATLAYARTFMHGDAYGASREDQFPLSLMQHHARWREHTNDLTEIAKVFLIYSEAMDRRGGNQMYGKAVNLSRWLRAQYDAALSQFDLLMMPTLPMRATPIPPADAPLSLSFQRMGEMTPNTQAFDISHHPALTVPVGSVEGLPVGAMLVGRHFDEETLYRVAFALEHTSSDFQVKSPA